MGQVMRTISYDRAANERQAVSALTVAGHNLQWFRLDDGVMGGRSETNVQPESLVSKDGILHFTGTINTQGGGFASIRAPLPPGLFISSTTGLQMRLQGDGKTYKFLVSQGQGSGGPFAQNPSWQFDIPTVAKKTSETTDDSDLSSWQEVTIPFQDLLPNFGGSGRQSPYELKKQYTFDPREMKEIGLMISLKLATGQPNPPETFGEGIFTFELKVRSIELIHETDTHQADSAQQDL